MFLFSSFFFFADCGFVVGEGDSDFFRSPVIMTPRQMETLGRRIAVEVKASVEPVAAGTYSILYVVILISFAGCCIFVIFPFLFRLSLD